MHAHFLYHIAFEGPGNIEPWLKSRGYRITATRFDKDPRLPDHKDVDFLIIMGGPMSVNDESVYPWLVSEKQFIRDCIAAGKPVLGICLGSQLIASALGARVYPNRYKEIGWLPVLGLPSADPAVFSFPSTFEVLQWHGDTFDLPAGAVQLARSEACENQAFQLGRHVIGLQFHPETTTASLRKMVSRSRSELVTAKYVQAETEILGVDPGIYRQMKKLMGEVLTLINSK